MTVLVALIFVFVYAASVCCGALFLRNLRKDGYRLKPQYLMAALTPGVNCLFLGAAVLRWLFVQR